MKSPVTIGSFDLTTRQYLIMHLVGLSVDCVMVKVKKCSPDKNDPNLPYVIILMVWTKMITKTFICLLYN